MKKTKVRKHLRKKRFGRTKVRKHKRRLKGVKIDRYQKEAFNALDSSKIETGGHLDFEKGNKLQNATIYFGKENEIDIPLKDYEVGFHTHPPPPVAINTLPSWDDIDAHIDDIQQAHLILHDNNVTMLLKNKFRKKKIDKKALKKDIENIDKKYVGQIDMILPLKYQREKYRHIWGEYDKALKKHGLGLRFIPKKKKAFNIPVRAL